MRVHNISLSLAVVGTAALVVEALPVSAHYLALFL
jgi:hypothetical protein